MKQLVITILGEDRPGLVESISSVILENHGNWLSSNLSHLLGHFAGIIQVEVAEEHLQTFQNALNGLPKLDVRIEKGNTEIEPVELEQLNFVITGNDRPGIVQELASVIRHKGANITNLNSRQQNSWKKITSSCGKNGLPPRANVTSMTRVSWRWTLAIRTKRRTQPRESRKRPKKPT